MGTFQASSISVRSVPSVPKLPVTIRRARPRAIGSRASTEHNTERPGAPLDMSSESAVIREAIAGSTEAQQNLFATRTGRLYKAAFAVLRNREDAEDALQDGLINACTKLRTFEGRSSFSSWLTRIVINAALMIRRKKNAHPEASLDEILEIQAKRVPRGAVDPRSDPEKIYAANEIKALIERQVRKLSPEMQKASRLRAINGLSTAESCRALGIPESVCKSRVFRARRKLANSLLQSA